MIIYKGKPLLGEDSSVSNTSEFFAIAGTALFWLIFLIFSFVIKPQPKKQYKEVQIVLSSTPVVQKTEEAPAPAEAAAASAASSEPVVEKVEEIPPAPAPKAEPAPKKVETPKPKAQTQPKKETVKPKTTQKVVDKPAVTPKQTEPDDTFYPGDIMDQFNSIQKSKPKQDFDWSQFDNDESEESQATDQNKVQNDAPAFSGSAGTAAQNSSQGISSKRSEDFYNNKAASGDTEASLKNIQNTNQNGNSPTNKGDAPTSDRSNKDSMKWIKGNVRKPLNSLNRNLSSIDEMKNQITKETPFTITFSVDSNGHVIRSSIVISNAAMLIPNVKNEMIEHISWLEFTSGEGIASAEFIWNLAPQ